MITVTNLVKRYAGNEVLSGISLEVKKGDVAAIIGPSGGGKSTFLRCINALESFQGGEVRVGDLALGPGMNSRDHGRHLQQVRKRVGFVFQSFNLFPHMSVLENLIEAPVHVNGESRDEAISRGEQLLERVGIRAKRDAFPRDLSGGQQQRVAIARTLMMQPEAVLFDEPTSALDPVMAGEVLAVMADLARGGQTMIVVTHQMDFARDVSDHVYVFAEGKVVEYGPPKDVFSDPRHAITKAFLKVA